MLYDPKWEKQAETKADPYSLASLIAWLEKQPAETKYDYYDIRNCLICRYLKANGIAFTSAGSADFAPGNYEQRVQLPGWEQVTCGEPTTFGAALERARTIAAREL